MKVHESEYEKQGWIPVNKKLPEVMEKVNVCSINLMDWNLEEMKWSSTGRYRIFDEKAVWTISGTTATKQEVFTYPVTHWKPLYNLTTP